MLYAILFILLLFIIFPIYLGVMAIVYERDYRGRSIKGWMERRKLKKKENNILTFQEDLFSKPKSIKTTTLHKIPQTNPIYIPKRSMVVKNKIKRKRRVA